MEIKDKTYWQDKIRAWTNESVCKIFDIKNRKEISKEIRSVLLDDDTSIETQSLIKTANYIASGLTKAVFPKDDDKVNENILLTHPLVKGKNLEFSNPIKTKAQLDSLIDEIKLLIKEDISYTNDLPEDEKYKERFNYLFFCLNKRLRNHKEGEIGKLGAYWDILPSDTRIPDHPMWHHFGLTSAIYSSLAENKDNTDAEKQKENLSMVVYSITPVQDFIMKARKLRDYWTGSVILSYLAFTGITKVIQTLGADHILYPSLHNQALMEQWLKNENKEYETLLDETDPIIKKLNSQSKSIASFPNKFVFICNNKDVEEISNEIKGHIDEEWKNIANIVKNYIAKRTSSFESKTYDDIWNNTIDKYWKYSWASTNFVTINDETVLKSLLSESKYKDELNVMKDFSNSSVIKNTKYDVSNLYGTTHSLAQGLLAAGKNRPVFDNVRHSQNGKKCPLCGEGEVLNNSPIDVAANVYNKNAQNFWKTLGNSFKTSANDYSQVGKTEMLCAVCALKRFLPIAIKEHKDHLLYTTLKNSDGFPSTTSMSAYEYLESKDDAKKKELIEILHHADLFDEEETDKLLKDSKGFETKYYAFLLMDGDKMGDLINGQTTEATWNDVININDKNHSIFFDKKLQGETRTITPALHSMISDSLNNFARYGVQPLVNDMGKGKLIYAGGDDVCAILPLSKAFETADKIRQVYTLSYAHVTNEGSKAILKNEQDNNEEEKLSPSMSKIVMHLGHSDKENTKISLSGAIIIAHHKQTLKEVIMDAHKVLDGIAKEKSGRNSLAIRLKKRSGGDRDVWFKWDEINPFSDDQRTCKTSFLNIVNAAKTKELSSSLLYKIGAFRSYIQPFVVSNEEDYKKDSKLHIKNNKEHITKLFEYELSHSGFESNVASLAVDIAGVCIKCDKLNNDEDWYNPEACIIANFMGTKVKGGKNE